MSDCESRFDELARRYLPALQSYCLAKICDAELAQDLAQETLLCAYNRFETLRDPSRFQAWLFGIAKRCSWNWFRKKKRDPLAKPPSPTEPQALHEPADPYPNPADRAQQQAAWNETLRALQKLRFPYREAVILRYFEELSYSEMAERLGISEDGVDQRLTRARRQLKTYLSHWEPES